MPTNPLITWYVDTLHDIENNMNLQQHLGFINNLLTGIDIALDDARQKGSSLKTLEEFRNDVFYLKYQISERT